MNKIIIFRKIKIKTNNNIIVIGYIYKESTIFNINKKLIGYKFNEKIFLFE